MATYLVALATGQQGGYTVKHLLSSGAKIHAVVRDPSSTAARQLQEMSPTNITLFKGNLTDVDVWRAAAQGTKGLFLNLPDPAPTATDAEVDASTHAIATAILRASREAGAQSLVVSSVMFTFSQSSKWDNSATSKLGLRTLFLGKKRLEDAAREAGLPHTTILRLGWLNGNYLVPASRHVYPELAGAGELAHALAAGSTMQHVDEEDVGRYAAAALLGPERFGGKAIDLANESLDMDGVAEIMARVSGRRVSARRRSAEEVERLVAEPRTMPLALPFEIWAGRIEFKSERGVRGDEFGIPLTSLEEYFRKDKDKLLASLPPA
ncbi:NAD(P)-binding protein [Polyplosphaeria fusca]|uniref:NAD(P)-binding protein n=1 Tax=Polyplosphaeria fusca TaxID=682080 RepID=A0A9P4R3H5_9PLEO|nr:NAD(P)-binding protein [Polyplosphaeria fusca]